MKNRKTILFILGTLFFLCFIKFKDHLIIKENIKEIDTIHWHLVKENSSLIDGKIKKSTRYMNTHTKKEKIQKLPEVILIGTSKSGTRALINYLGLHPSIAMPGPEIHFFDENYHRGYEWYRYNFYNFPYYLLH